MFPQARKHCRNGDADTDCDWDNKKGGRNEETEKVEKARKQDKKAKEGRTERRNAQMALKIT